MTAEPLIIYLMTANFPFYDNDAVQKKQQA